MSQTATKQPEATGKKHPKETDEIRAVLDDYVAYQRRIDNNEERLAYLKDMAGSPSSPSLSGMPSGSRDGSSKQERDVLKQLELEEKLSGMYEVENDKREQIEGLIEQMEDPDEQTVIEMRYLDRANYRAISAALHGNETDYDEHERRYLKKTFKIHGSALQSLAKIYNKERGERNADRLI